MEFRSIARGTQSEPSCSRHQKTLTSIVPMEAAPQFGERQYRTREFAANTHGLAMQSFRAANTPALVGVIGSKTTPRFLAPTRSRERVTGATTRRYRAAGVAKAAKPVPAKMRTHFDGRRGTSTWSVKGRRAKMSTVSSCNGLKMRSIFTNVKGSTRQKKTSRERRCPINGRYYGASRRRVKGFLQRKRSAATKFLPSRALPSTRIKSTSRPALPTKSGRT